MSRHIDGQVCRSHRPAQQYMNVTAPVAPSFYNTKTAIHFQSFLPHNAAARRSAPVVGPAGPGPRAPAESRQRCLSMFAYVYACNRSLVIPSISLLIKLHVVIHPSPADTVHAFAKMPCFCGALLILKLCCCN